MKTFRSSPCKSALYFSNFFQLVRNPIYCGRIKVDAYKEELATTVKGQHEPIISEETFYQVQDILDGRKEMCRQKIPEGKNCRCGDF